MIRLLGLRFKKIEEIVSANDPDKIIIKNLLDLHYIWDKSEIDDSFLKTKKFYYDISFFRGDREKYMEANRSRDLNYIYNRKNYRLWHIRRRKEKEERRKLEKLEREDERLLQQNLALKQIQGDNCT